MGNETKQHTLTEKQFCEIYTQFRGVEIDKVAQIKHCSFTGEELFEFLSFAAKANELRIKELEAQLEQRWISAYESPKKPQEVVVYFKNAAGLHVVGAYWDGKDFVDLCERCGTKERYWPDAIVVLWQPQPPLPASIKERGEKQ